MAARAAPHTVRLAPERHRGHVTGDATGDATGGTMGDTERVWLTYEEAGQALGIKAASAKRLSFRRHWPHRAGNDGLARVGVPVTALPPVTGDATGDATGRTRRAAPGDDSGTSAGDKPDGAAALALALDRIEALAGRVGHAQAEVERLRAELADALAAAADARRGEEEATRRAREVERDALDGWRVAAELARRLAAPPPAPAAPPRRRGQ